MTKPYLSDIINDHKTRGLLRYHLGNENWVEETSSEWKIQLKSNFILFLLKVLMRVELCIQKVIM